MKSHRTKILFTGFAPNITWDHVKLSLFFVLLPIKWFSLREGTERQTAKDALANYLNRKVALLDSGRSALHIALTSLGIGEGDEVIVQAFTCVVVINAIKWTGAKPVYADINETYNIDVEKVESRITPRTKAIIVQHTFGIPADIVKLQSIAKKHGLRLVEDCAHALGMRIQGQLAGTFGDIAMFSFGSDKVISCVRGGAITTDDPNLYNAIQHTVEDLPEMPIIEVFRHLFHSIVFAFGKKTYALGIGKVILYMTRKFKITSSIIEAHEKAGLQAQKYPAKLPNALASILNKEIPQIDTINQHRQQIAQLYNTQIKNPLISKASSDKETLYLRYPIRVADPADFIKKAKKENILLGDWYQVVAAPKDADQSRICYVLGSCPHAEQATKEVVNLPTNRNISKADANRIIDFCNKYA